MRFGVKLADGSHIGCRTLRAAEVDPGIDSNDDTSVDDVEDVFDVEEASFDVEPVDVEAVEVVAVVGVECAYFVSDVVHHNRANPRSRGQRCRPWTPAALWRTACIRKPHWLSGMTSYIEVASVTSEAAVVRIDGGVTAFGSYMHHVEYRCLT